MQRTTDFKKLCSVILVLALVVTMIMPANIGEAAISPKLNVSSKTVAKGKTFKLSVKNKISGSKYIWSSSKTNIAKVNKKGVITGLKSGKTTITCKVQAPNRTYKLKTKIIVNEPAKSIKINNKIIEVQLGKTYTFNTQVKPKTSNDSQTWNSSDNAIIKVNKKGKITALKEGSATIKVTTGSKKSDFVVVNVIGKKVEEVIEATTENEKDEDKKDVAILPPTGGGGSGSKATPEDPIKPTSEYKATFSEEPDTWENKIDLSDGTTIIQPIINEIQGIAVTFDSKIKSSPSSTGSLLVQVDSGVGNEEDDVKGISYEINNGMSAVSASAFMPFNLMQRVSVKATDKEYTISAKVMAKKDNFIMKFGSQNLGVLLEKEIKKDDWTEVKATIRIPGDFKDMVTFSLGSGVELSSEETIEYYFDDLTITSVEADPIEVDDENSSIIEDNSKGETFKMTLKASKDQYYTVAVLNGVKKGAWTKLEGTITIPKRIDNEDLEVYVEMPNNNNVDFYIDEFTLSPQGTGSKGNSGAIKEGFENEKNDFFGFGACSLIPTKTIDDIKAKAGKQYLKITNRYRSWEGPAINITEMIDVGVDCKFTVWVRTDGIVGRDTDNDLETYQMTLKTDADIFKTVAWSNIIKKNEWTKLEGTIEIPEAQSLELYIEMPKNSVAEFSVDEFIITSEDGSKTILKEDFEVEKDMPFYSAGYCQVNQILNNKEKPAKEGNGYLQATNRTQTWEGVMIDITEYVTPETKYKFTIWVRNDDTSEKELFEMFYKAGEGDDSEYELVASSYSKYGAWTKLEGSIVVTGSAISLSDKKTIYVQMPNTPTGLFSIDNFSAIRTDNPNNIIMSDSFESEDSIFRGTGGCRIERTKYFSQDGDYHLQLRNRKIAWEGAEVDITDLENGVEYRFTIWIRPDGSPREELISLNLSTGSGDEEIYNTIALKYVKKSVWTLIEGTFDIREGMENINFNISMPDDTLTNLLVDDFIIREVDNDETIVISEGFEFLTNIFWPLACDFEIGESREAEPAKEGTKYLKVTNRTESWGCPIINITDRVQAGKTYKFSAWVRR